MKNEQLFDLLGEIDDKFYLEAREDDPVEPILLKPIKRPLWQTIGTAAASVAVVAGIAIGAVALKNSGVIHPPIDSDGSNGYQDTDTSGGIDILTPTQSPLYLEVSAKDVDECKQYMLTHYINPSRAEDLEWDWRITDLNFDGYEEIVLECNYGLAPRIFNKTAEGMAETGTVGGDGQSSYLIDIDDLYPYEENGERYWYFFIEQDSSTALNGAVYSCSVELQKFDGENYFSEHSMAYWYKTDEGADRPTWHFTQYSYKNGSLETAEISEEEFRALWAKYPALPYIKVGQEMPGDPPYYTNDYIALQWQKIPDVHVDLSNLNTVDLPGIRLSSFKYGDYIIELNADKVHTDKSADPNMLYAHQLYIGISKGQLGISKIGVRTISVSMGQMHTWQFDINKLGEYFDLFELDGGTVAVFNYDNHLSPELAKEMGVTLNESEFFGIYEVDGELTVTDLWGDFTEVGVPNDYTNYGGSQKIYCNADLSHELEANGNIITDVTNGIMYCFYPERFEGNPYDEPHFAVTAGDNPNTDPEADVQTFDEYVIDTDKCGEYTLKLIAKDGTVTTHMADLWTVDYLYYTIKYDDIFLTVEKDSSEIYRESVMEYLPFIACRVEEISMFVQPFEMKDGIGFVLYTCLDQRAHMDVESCELFMMKDGKPVHLEITGEFHWVMQISRFFEADYDANKIGGYKIDFTNGTCWSTSWNPELS